MDHIKQHDTNNNRSTTMPVTQPILNDEISQSQKGAKSLLIVRKRKIINKKRLRAIIRNNAVSSRISIRYHPQQSQKNGSEDQSTDKTSTQYIKNRNFISFIQNHGDNVTCPICIAELIEPVITECAHLFCLQCIQKTLMNGNKCPLCRQTIATEDNFGLKFDRQAEKLISKLNNYASEEERETHYRSYFQWKNKRFLTQQEMALQGLVDVWIPQGWHTATIKQIYKNDQGKTKTESILVQIPKNNKTIREIIDIDSFRLARPEFYNKKKQKFNFRFGWSDLLNNNFQVLNGMRRPRAFYSLRSRVERDEIGPISANSFTNRLESQVVNNDVVDNGSLEFLNLPPVNVVENISWFESINQADLNPMRTYAFQINSDVSYIDEHMPI